MDEGQEARHTTSQPQRPTEVHTTGQLSSTQLDGGQSNSRAHKVTKVLLIISIVIWSLSLPASVIVQMIVKFVLSEPSVHVTTTAGIFTYFTGLWFMVGWMPVATLLIIYLAQKGKKV